MKGSIINLRNSTIDNSKIRGVWLQGSDSLIENTVFINNNSEHDSSALYLENSSPEVSDSRFENNTLGIYADVNSDPMISNPTFINNIRDTYPEDLLGEDG